MTAMLQNAMQSLKEAIFESSEYKTYRELRELVMSDETNRALLKEYQKTQTTLQMAAMAGKEADAETVERFSKLSGLLYMNQDIAQYLLAQLHFQKLMGEMFQELAQATGMDIDLPGM